jgi:ribonuclease HII
MGSKLRISEEQQYDEMMVYERDARIAGFQVLAGIDEAGRGPLAGPVVAAACILNPDYPILGVNDSKKLTPGKREILFTAIKQHASCFSIAQIEHDEIDRINILQATLQAMRNAVKGLDICPDLLLIDAIDLKHTGIPVRAIIKGDTLSVSIAAASILAKVTRDCLMNAYDIKYPGYGFKNHKGYGTAEHYAALALLGPTPIHRLSFLKNR